VVPPTEPCALRSTQPLKVSTRDFSWGKGGRCVWLTTYHCCSAETSRKSGALIYPEPLGPPRPVARELYFAFTTYVSRKKTVPETCDILYCLGWKSPRILRELTVIDSSQNPTEQICCAGERGSLEGTWSLRDRK